MEGGGRRGKRGSVEMTKSKRAKEKGREKDELCPVCYRERPQFGGVTKIPLFTWPADVKYHIMTVATPTITHSVVPRALILSLDRKGTHQPHPRAVP